MNIIDKVISTPATRSNVRRAIPVLVYWATTGQTNRRYNDLIKALGYARFSGIGHVLGCIQEVINALAKETGKSIPTLNTLCKRDGKTTMICFLLMGSIMWSKIAVPFQLKVKRLLLQDWIAEP